MDEDEKICFNCAAYFPASLNEATEFGVCLLDEELDSFADDLLDGRMDEACLELVEQKKFEGGRSACESFEPAESWEIDDDSALGQEIARLAETGELEEEKLAKLLISEHSEAIDWSAVPVDMHEVMLESGSPEAREKAVQSLAALTSMENQAACDALVRFMKALPPPETLDEVHFKVKVLELMDRKKTHEDLVPHLVEELYRTPSNNTTRQWIAAIFRFLEGTPLDLTRGPVERMLGDKRFSPRLKKKMKKILYGPKREWDEL